MISKEQINQLLKDRKVVPYFPNDSRKGVQCYLINSNVNNDNIDFKDTSIFLYGVVGWSTDFKALLKEHHDTVNSCLWSDNMSSVIFVQ